MNPYQQGNKSDKEMPNINFLAFSDLLYLIGKVLRNIKMSAKLDLIF